ncbi:MAG: hypothetical protein RR514_07910, partial [Christensenella sp.]
MKGNYMLRIVKYLKPYAALVLAAVLLLFAQAYCDLSLPNYMSKIVDRGIQQGGMENAIPMAVSESTMNTLFNFMDESERQTVMANYTLADKTSANYDAYLQDYPAIAKENIYVETMGNVGATAVLNTAFSKAFASVSTINQMMNAENGGSDMLATDTEANAGVGAAEKVQISPDLMQFFAYYAQKPQNSDFFNVLNADKSQKTEVYAALNGLLEEKLGALDDAMLTQMAIPAVKAEY